ncbi:hypothetical protein [Alkaliphilus serpentinus]|uniref:Uncharacterized protein n=1 Tax=Alkaliphilus serpentinus TaxID=1482731 RepID=A0A833HNF1_9FIRM|nr:hypothetical protein [Alkaliphilus serpentinus]KAB3529281.1 hypothetical protein F8153_09745 [Alkaliphilus serpentinus]
MDNNIIILTTGIFVTIVLISFYRYKNILIFNKYFSLDLYEGYNLDKIYHIKITGKIIPQVTYLDIPFDSISIKIRTKAIVGEIHHNNISIELISPKDRKRVIYLIKKSYIQAVKAYMKEILKNNKEEIKLIKLSEKHRPKVSKLACNTCKHKVQCKITFNVCNYQREANDPILKKGIIIDCPSVKAGINNLHNHN